MSHLDGEEEFHKWCESLQGRNVTLVAAGQSGAGKTTLVNNLLRLSDRVADAPVTNEVKCHNSCIKGTDITILDTPSITGASAEDEYKILAQLYENTNGKPDMLLYCVSMAPNSKIGESDRKIIKLLTKAFTSRIWERTVLVLTFADFIKERNKQITRRPTIEMEMKHCAKKFETILRTTLSDHSVTVIPVLQDEGIEIRPAKEIAAVPAGEIRDEKILPHKKWNASIYEEVLRKCKIDAIPALLTILDVFTRQMYILTGSMAIGGAVLGALALGVITGGVGALIGGAIGGLGFGALGAVISKNYYGIARTRFRREHTLRAALPYNY
jgi:GTPase Era involved in 16S rRNA processing